MRLKVVNDGSKLVTLKLLGASGRRPTQTGTISKMFDPAGADDLFNGAAKLIAADTMAVSLNGGNVGHDNLGGPPCGADSGLARPRRSRASCAL